MNDFPIWHMDNASPFSVNLYQADESHYIVTQDGEWTPIISCGLYIIINQPLLSFFQEHIDTPIPFHAVSIYDRVLNQYFEGYYRIYLEHEITPDTQKMAAETGIQIWGHEGSGGIFISSTIKKALEESNVHGIETHPGFSRYAGSI